VAQQYPLRDQLTIFLAPSLLILAAEGAEWVRQAWPARLTAVGAMGIVLLAALPVYDFVRHLPVYRREETKVMFAFV
jgi:hypothetical protein